MSSKAAEMKRNPRGEFTCKDYPAFRPNMSPKEMFQAGIFGGTYFRDITIHGKHYKGAWREFEQHGWFEGLNVKTHVACSKPIIARNCYKAKCGQGLDEWVGKGWIKTEFDSHGWVHWYCRFFLGRRCEDDERQISRWSALAGPKGRWKRNLIAKCVKAGKPFDDEGVSPTVRQLLLHWGYELTAEHFDEYKKLLENGHKTSFIPQHEMKHVVKVPVESDEENTKEKRNRKVARENNEREQRMRKRARNR